MNPDSNLNSLARTLAERACREILAEVHFGSERTGPCSASNPENAKFLDRRAAEFAPKFEAVIREAIEKTLEETRTEVIKTIMSGRTINNFSHVPEIVRALEWVWMDVNETFQKIAIRSLKPAKVTNP